MALLGILLAIALLWAIYPPVVVGGLLVALFAAIAWDTDTRRRWRR